MRIGCRYFYQRVAPLLYTVLYTTYCMQDIKVQCSTCMYVLYIQDTKPLVPYRTIPHYAYHTMYLPTNIQTCIHTYIQTDREPYRRTGIQAYRRMANRHNRHAGIHAQRHTDAQTFRQFDIQTFRHVDIQASRHTRHDMQTCRHARTCRQTHIQTYMDIQTCKQKTYNDNQ